MHRDVPTIVFDEAASSLTPHTDSTEEKQRAVQEVISRIERVRKDLTVRMLNERRCKPSASAEPMQIRDYETVHAMSEQSLTSSVQQLRAAMMELINLMPEAQRIFGLAGMCEEMFTIDIRSCQMLSKWKQHLTEILRNTRILGDTVSLVPREHTAFTTFRRHETEWPGMSA